MNTGDARLSWLGDDYCDKNDGGSQANFNCEKFAYDCCDCASRMGLDEDECWEDMAKDNSYCKSKSRRRLETHPLDTRRLAQTKKTTACHICKYKQYCPAGIVESEVAPCPRSFYCPHPGAKYQCPVNHACTNTQKVKCKGGMYCPQNATIGMWSHMACPAKYFCSEPQYKEICPEGYYCRGGDIKPSKCSFFQTCPEGTKVPEGTARMMLLFMLAVFVTFELINLKWKQQSEKLALERKKKAADEASKLIVGRQERFFRQDASLNEDFTGFRVLQPDKTKLSFEFSDLSLTLKSGTRIIDHVSGQVKAGKMTAIMGPSGCGKTTMLNILREKAGYGIIGGSLKVTDGKSEFDSIEPFKRIVGFVPQDDIMHSELTVAEAITFASLLKNKSSVDQATRFKMVEEVIEVLDLEKCRNSVIGDQETRGVSGGQRKRASIALEIVGNPSICFMDEPTSGLDSTTSIELIYTLKKMTDAGMTIVMVIHQPRYEIFNTIDDIFLLGQNGRPVYIGASSKTLEYFTSIGFPCPSMMSPADHFLDVMSGTVMNVTKKHFTTADLSDWWKERQLGAANPSTERSGSTFSNLNPMRVPLGATGRNGGHQMMEIETITEVSQKEPLHKLLAAWGAEYANSQLKHWKTESVFALKAFKPGVLDKYRTPPSNVYQFGVCTWRAFRQIFALNKKYSFVSDCIVLVTVGAVLGWMFGPYLGPNEGGRKQWQEEASKMPLRNFIATLALALTTCLRALGTFGHERPAFWRERNSGLSTFSYFLGKNVADMIFVIIFPATFMVLFVSIAQPRGNYTDYYTTMFYTAWAATGQGYLISVTNKPESAKFNGLVTVLLCVMFSGMEPPLSFFKGFMRKVLSCSFARWSVESLTIIEFKQYPEIYDIYMSSVTKRHGWEMDENPLCLQGLLVLGVVFRVLSFLMLKLGNRQKG